MGKKFLTFFLFFCSCPLPGSVDFYLISFEEAHQLLDDLSGKSDSAVVEMNVTSVELTDSELVTPTSLPEKRIRKRKKLFHVEEYESGNDEGLPKRLSTRNTSQMESEASEQESESENGIYNITIMLKIICDDHFTLLW